jgi:hypothetical protein
MLVLQLKILIKIQMSESSMYELNLIYGIQRGDLLGWSSFDHFFKQYLKTRKGLEDRYGEFRSTLSIPGTKEVIEKLDYVFFKIETFKKIDAFENYELEVYIDALIAGIHELNDHLREIDEEFDL